MLSKYLLTSGTLTAEQSRAADLDSDGRLDVYDLVMLRQILVG